MRLELPGRPELPHGRVPHRAISESPSAYEPPAALPGSGRHCGRSSPGHAPSLPTNVPVGPSMPPRSYRAHAPAATAAGTSNGRRIHSQANRGGWTARGPDPSNEGPGPPDPAMYHPGGMAGAVTPDCAGRVRSCADASRRSDSNRRRNGGPARGCPRGTPGGSRPATARVPRPDLVDT